MTSSGRAFWQHAFIASIYEMTSEEGIDGKSVKYHDHLVKRFQFIRMNASKFEKQQLKASVDFDRTLRSLGIEQWR